MIKHRNMWLQVLLFIITLRIYGIYWYCSTFKEMVGTSRPGRERRLVDDINAHTHRELILVLETWRVGGRRHEQ